jgi:hypothetical protein
VPERAAGDDYLRVVEGAARADAPTLDDFEHDIIAAPAGSTVAALVRRLGRLGPGVVLVGRHRIIVAMVGEPAPAAALPATEVTERGETAGVGPPDPDHEISDSDLRTPDSEPDSPDREADSGPPTAEDIARQIAVFTRRRVTEEQLRVGLRIGAPRARILRDQVNEDLYPGVHEPLDD